MHSVKLNADVGEGFPNDEILMPYLTYCNIACGAHAGNLESIEKTIKLAQSYTVKLGAHLSYPDKENFGRKSLDISTDKLASSLKSQLKDFIDVAKTCRGEIHHIKAHGALYHDLINKPAIKEVFLDSALSIIQKIHLFLPAHIRGSCKNFQNFNVIYEGFADRQYNTDLKLLSRSKENAVLNNAEDISSQIIKLHNDAKVFTIDGSWKDLVCDTICIHGDHQNLESYFPEVIQILKSRNLLV